MIASPENPIWNIPESEFPTRGPVADQLRFALRYAVLAPSRHNSQPWRFRVQEDGIEVLPDRERWLLVADADQRELHISLGCAVENLLVALDHFSLPAEPELRRSPDGTSLSIVVRLVPAAPRAYASASFRSILSRRTVHEAFAAIELRDEHRAALLACVDPDGPALTLLTDSEQLRALDALAITADEALFADREYRDELSHWIGEGATGVGPLKARLQKLAVSTLNLGGLVARRDSELILASPCVGVISTASDSHEDHFEVGRLFERIALSAAAFGIGLQPLSRLTEVPEIREMLRPFLTEGHIAQHPFRLGYLESVPNERTSRRPVEEVTA